jgi:hypothetical protein
MRGVGETDRDHPVRMSAYSQHTLRGPVSVASPVVNARGSQLPPLGVADTRPETGAKPRLQAEPWLPLPICSVLPPQFAAL